MQSISDIPPKVRRRCASEGRRGKGRPRPVSALLYPASRVRADTEPSSPPSSYRVGLASSTKNLSLNESPKNKPSPGLNRFLPRRKSKDGKLSSDASHILIQVMGIRDLSQSPGFSLDFQDRGGHVAAARKRSHQWCVSLTPNNTKTMGRMTCHCFQ